MDLYDSPDRQRADLDEPHPPEICCVQNVYVPLVAEQDVRLIEQRVPVDGPETPGFVYRRVPNQAASAALVSWP